MSQTSGICALVLYAGIDKDLEKKFRVTIAEKFVGQSGALTKDIEEVIRLWLKT